MVPTAPVPPPPVKLMAGAEVYPVPPLLMVTVETSAGITAAATALVAVV